MTSHLEDGTIHELIDGEIPSTALAPIRDHLAACAECRARLDVAQAETDETDALIEALDDPAVPVRTAVVVPIAVARSRAWIRNAAWAASLVIAVGAGYFAGGNPVDGVVDAQPTRGAQELRRADEPVGASREDGLTAPVTTPTVTTTSRQPAPVESDATGGGARESAARDAVERREAVREVPPTTGGAAAPISATPAPMADAPAAAVRSRVAAEGDVEGRRTLGRTANQLVPRDQLTSKQSADARPDTIDFTRAVSVMGGRLLLVDGMVPVRLELEGSSVRVVYRVNEGDLVLTQSVREGVVSHRLIAPAGFNADSLAALQKRIKG